MLNPRGRFLLTWMKIRKKKAMSFEFCCLTLPLAPSCTQSGRFINNSTSRLAPIPILSREGRRDLTDHLGKSEGLTSRSCRSQMCFPACLSFLVHPKRCFLLGKISSHFLSSATNYTRPFMEKVYAGTRVQTTLEEMIRRLGEN